MGEAFITRRGGGAGSGSLGLQGKCTIAVSYPTGSNCTVSKGGLTYTAKDTLGADVFIVSAGTWKVEITTDGEEPVSKEVTVKAGECADVELSFWDGILYDAGNQYADITGGWVSVRGSVAFNESSVRVTGGASYADSIVSTANKIDLKGYTTLHINISANTSDGVSGEFQVYDADAASDITSSHKVASIQANEQGEYALDISSLATGSNTQYFVGYKVAGTTGVTRYYEFNKIWLSK